MAKGTALCRRGSRTRLYGWKWAKNAETADIAFFGTRSGLSLGSNENEKIHMQLFIDSGGLKKNGGNRMMASLDWNGMVEEWQLLLLRYDEED